MELKMNKHTAVNYKKAKHHDRLSKGYLLSIIHHGLRKDDKFIVILDAETQNIQRVHSVHDCLTNHQLNTKQIEAILQEEHKKPPEKPEPVCGLHTISSLNDPMVFTKDNVDDWLKSTLRVVEKMPICENESVEEHGEKLHKEFEKVMKLDAGLYKAILTGEVKVEDTDEEITYLNAEGCDAPLIKFDGGTVLYPRNSDDTEMSSVTKEGQKITYLTTTGDMNTINLNNQDRRYSQENTMNLNDTAEEFAKQKQEEVDQFIAEQAAIAKQGEHNAADKVASYETTDGKLFKLKKDADQHQLDIDFEQWFTVNNFYINSPFQHHHLMRFMRENREEFMKFARRVK